MPIRSFSVAEAKLQAAGNAYRDWPVRGAWDDRFTGLASPAFSVKTELNPGEKIFTIGSCFARQVEIVLAERGFDLPVRNFEVSPELWGQSDTAVLNNYVTSAATTQIRWAFGRDISAYDVEKDCFQYIKDGKVPGYGDPYMAMVTRPKSAELITESRERISALYRELADVRVVTVTLGLVEAWYDIRMQRYINIPPPLWALNSSPERFRLDILSYDEVYSQLRELVMLLKDVCRDDLVLILTVSPVPMMRTWTDQDVCVANTYSKSVLRAAAEHVVHEFDFVGYYPSFESFMATSKTLAFLPDQTHTKPEAARHTVTRMVDAYFPAVGEQNRKRSIGLAKLALKNKQYTRTWRLIKDFIREKGKSEPEEELMAMLFSVIKYERRLRDNSTDIFMDTRYDNNPDALTVRSKWHLDHDMVDEAVDCLRKAHGMKKRNAGGRAALAFALLRQGSFEEAKDLLDEIVMTSLAAPAKANWHAVYAIVADARGNRETAEHHVDQHISFSNLKTYGQHADREEVFKKLKSRILGNRVEAADLRDAAVPAGAK